MSLGPPSALPPRVDLLVIGGGITGAGIALEAARRGVAVLLVEARDFASGTSSRSSKLVHGGLRYLASGHIGLTRESVRERRQLLHDAPGLVEPLRFLMGHYQGHPPGPRKLAAGLALYDFFNGVRTRGFHSAADMLQWAPHLQRPGLLGGSSHLEASTDDARLVMRVLHEACYHGAHIANHVAAVELLREQGRVCGARLQPEGGAATQAVRAQCVLNATGTWADALRGQLGQPQRLRPLRGSHLLLPLWRLPVAQAFTLMHPRDRRPVFAFPWEGMALVGTTDLDHAPPLSEEPAITAAEAAYLMEALHFAFPPLQLTLADVVSTYAGVRPVVAGGAADPSREARDHIVLHEQGLVTVTGGKLTTFRAIALDALRQVARHVPALAQLASRPDRDATIFEAVPTSARLAPLGTPLRQRLAGRYGRQADALVACARPGELEPVLGTRTLWAELRWAARSEWVRHLDDLLLRRTRLGLLLRDGAQALLPQLRPLCTEELGWDDDRWQAECRRYREIIIRCHSIPGPMP